jgi:SAM-dependent methyltransferase
MTGAIGVAGGFGVAGDRGAAGGSVSLQGAPGDERFAAAWLWLREPADHDARAGSLVTAVRDRLTGPLTVTDLGCGTGSTTRWLAPRLPGPQRWRLVDLDPDLLEAAAAGTRDLRDAGGGPVTVDTSLADATALRPADLAGTRLVTGSALLDLLDRDRLENLVAACTGAGCAALFTLTVVGQVRLSPPDPADADLAAAFDAHQRRPEADGTRLLGPDAVDAAVTAFTDRGWTTTVASSPWRLGPDRGDLADAWLTGWTAAAVEQRPDLAPVAARFLERRRAQIRAGGLHAEVGHADLLALPPSETGT